MMKISRPDATVTVTPLSNNLNKIVVEPLGDLFLPIKSLETKYPIEVIERILEIKGSAYLCDEIARDEDPKYVQQDLKEDLKAYFPDENFANKRILDFGCGSGASSMILSRFFPNAKIVGVELEEKLLSIAKLRLNFYKYPNVEFHHSPSGNELPANIGEFDLVVMSAVYEHLLPEERQSVMPPVWKSVRKGGYLFMNMTPHRYFPVEHHTTGLPLINYFPETLAYYATKKFSKRTDPTEPWEMLLRRGIRGATENEILKILNKKENNSAELLNPNTTEIKDRIDLWFSQLNKERKIGIKKLIKYNLKILKFLTGIVLVPKLSLVFRKRI